MTEADAAAATGWAAGVGAGAVAGACFGASAAGFGAAAAACEAGGGFSPKTRVCERGFAATGAGAGDLAAGAAAAAAFASGGGSHGRGRGRGDDRRGGPLFREHRLPHLVDHLLRVERLVHEVVRARVLPLGRVVRGVAAGSRTMAALGAFFRISFARA